MSPPCTSPPTSVERASAAATGAASALPELSGLNDTPTDPACPGGRHGSLRAYRAHGCRCPEVMAHYRAETARKREQRVADRLAGLRHRPETEIDLGDVEAAVSGALRWRPVPDTLTAAERKMVALRLSRAGTGRTGMMSAREIEARTGICDRQVVRYLEQAAQFEAAVAAARQGLPPPDGLVRTVWREVVLHLAASMPAETVADRTGLSRGLVDRWLEREQQGRDRAAAEAAQFEAELAGLVAV